MTELIRFDDVAVSVRDKVLLNDVSFALAAGEKAVLRGRSGSGKSTVLKTLLVLQALARGRILFRGRPLAPASIRVLLENAAYIGQEPILGAESVREALLLPFSFNAHRGREPSEARLIEVLGSLALSPGLLGQSCASVSGGEKQRIALARALLLGKCLYLLDEVTSALDGESKQAVFAVLADPAFTVLSVAHDPDWIARCGVVYEMAEGRLTQEPRRGDA